MKRPTIFVAVLAVLILKTAFAEAAQKGYASARAACLAQAGTTEAIFSAKKATYAQGAVYKQCMTEKGHNVSVFRSDGSKLY